MTSEELREIVPPDVEGWMIEDIIWPARSFCSLCYDEDNWYYGPRYGKVHPDDAAAQIERRLVEWVIRGPSAMMPRFVTKSDFVKEDCYVVDMLPKMELYPTMLHALVAAYRSSKESKR